MTEPIVRCENVTQIHRTLDLEVVALSGVDLVVEPGELVGIVGPSGSGKSTLLSLLAGLASPSAGRVEVLGQDIGRLGERGRLRLRAMGIGIMAQNAGRNLLPSGRVIDNLIFAQRARRTSAGARRARSRELLALVGLEHHTQSHVLALSGGEQQRLGLAVALAGNPRLLLADEPTNQLDAEARDLVVDLLRVARDRDGVTVLAVTHDPDVGAAMDRSMGMRDGRLGTEHRVGESFGIVAADGSVQLPVDYAHEFPPGTRVRYVRRAEHLELHRTTPRPE